MINLQKSKYLQSFLLNFSLKSKIIKKLLVYLQRFRWMKIY